LPEIPPSVLAELAATDAFTDEQLTANALADPDNPPLTGEELDRIAAIRRLRDVRRRTGLSQAAFARSYHFSVGRLRDLEQGRTRPDSSILAYLTLIARDPEGVRKALAETVG
jgi:putative transcriptional regulator